MTGNGCSLDIDDYSDEIWESIFFNDIFSYSDILNISITCKRFLKICSSDLIWQPIKRKRWKDHDVDWNGASSYLVFKERHLIELDLKKTISIIGRECYQSNGINNSSLKCIISMMTSDLRIMLVLESLKYIIKTSVNDLNLVYLSEKIYALIHQHYVKHWWNGLLARPSEDVYFLERGAILISSWCNLHRKICMDSIHKELDLISERIRERVPSDYLRHRKPPKEQLKKILLETNRVLYEEMKFRGDATPYNCLNNSFLDMVLQKKTGSAVLLSIIYMVVNMRLGLMPQSVLYLESFIMRFETEDSDFLYVDAFDKGNIMTESQCMEKLTQIMPDNEVPMTADVFPTSIINNLEVCRLILKYIGYNLRRYRGRIENSCKVEHEACIEMDAFLMPNDHLARFLLTRLYLNKGVNLEQVIADLHSLQGVMLNDERVLTRMLCDAEKIIKECTRDSKPKHRSDPENRCVHYRVGMVMRHRVFNYNCVIYGWDPFCNHSENWKIQMGVYDLQYKDKQPFYKVLVSDKSIRYASQENIYPLTQSIPIDHYEVGKHFVSFDGHSYVACNMLKELYPDDQPIR